MSFPSPHRLRLPSHQAIIYSVLVSNFTINSECLRLYVIPVRQAKGLPTASFRYHLTMDTLAVQLCTSSLPTRTRDFHLLERAHGAQTGKRDVRLYAPLDRISINWYYPFCFILSLGYMIPPSRPALRQNRSCVYHSLGL